MIKITMVRSVEIRGERGLEKDDKVFLFSVLM
jgi:hypothetical protein